MMFPLFLLILGISGVNSDSHSLLIYTTWVSVNGSGLPEFSIVGYMDDKQIGNYNSTYRLARPVVHWMNKEGPDFWHMLTLRGQRYENKVKFNLKLAEQHYKLTGGFHSLQWLIGCELRDDGSIIGYDQYAYDGKDLMYLDTDKWVYIPQLEMAQFTTNLWNSKDIRHGERNQNYLEVECVELLKTFLKHGKEDLERRVTPEVKVTHQTSVGVTKLHCWVYGFHPRAVDVKWMKSDRDEVPVDEYRPILPNPDATYQTRVTVDVPVGEEDSYSCYVDHSSLEQMRIVKWDPKRDYTWVIGAVTGLVIFALVIGGIFFIYNKKKTGYKATSASDTSSSAESSTG